MNPSGKGWRVRANAEDEDQGDEHLAYALRARAPRCPRITINSQRSPPAATCEHEASAGSEPASNARELGFPSRHGEILSRERSSPMGEARRRFDKDFREGAVRLVRETGKPIAQVARDLGINPGTLGNWVDADRRRRGEGDGALSEDERAELARLRKENAELAMRCDVLKRSVALWVQDAMGR
jgi:transposase